MAIAQNSVVLLSFRGTQAGQRIILTHTLFVTAAGDVNRTYTEDMNELISKVSENGGLREAYLGTVPTAYTLNEIRAQGISPTRFVSINVGQVNQVGTNLGSGNVTNLAACITLRTALAGRRFVSNKHIGPIPSDVSSAGLLDASYRLQLDEVKTLLTTQIIPNGFDVPTYTPCIFHRPGISQTPTPTPITAGTVQTTTRVMRRRTVGLGE